MRDLIDYFEDSVLDGDLLVVVPVALLLLLVINLMNRGV